jgi:hypothetical protein
VAGIACFTYNFHECWSHFPSPWKDSNIKLYKSRWVWREIWIPPVDVRTKAITCPLLAGTSTLNQNYRTASASVWCDGSSRLG